MNCKSFSNKIDYTLILFNEVLISQTKKVLRSSLYLP